MKVMELYGKCTVADMTIHFSSDLIDGNRKYFVAVTIEDDVSSITEIREVTKEAQQAIITLFLYGDVGNEHLYVHAEPAMAMFSFSFRCIP